jgi:hypothetical protein
MNKIYILSSGEGKFISGFAIAEDGECIASHCSSHRSWTRHDMGINSDWKHDQYKKKYPNGYELVDYIDVPEYEWEAHDVIASLIALAKERDDPELEPFVTAEFIEGPSL